MSLSALASLLTNLVTLIQGITLKPRVVLFLLLVVCTLLLLMVKEGIAGRVGRGLVVDEGERGLDGALERLLMHLHQCGLALAMNRVTDQVLLMRERVSRHELFVADGGEGFR